MAGSVRGRGLTARFATTMAIVLAGAELRAQSFIESPNIPVAAWPDFPLIADLDGDGTSDFVVSTQNGNALTVLLANGSGGYATSTVQTGGDPQEVDAADLNADGVLDLVTPNAAYANVAVLLGNGFGSFAPAVVYPLGEGQFAFPRGVELADFNEDGLQDVVVSNNGTCSLSLFLGNGIGGLGPATSVPVLPENCGLGLGNPLEDVDSADFDGDGHLDLATCNSVWGTVATLKGTGTGTFLPAVAHGVNPPWYVAPMAVVATDLNGDQKPDLVTANRYTTASVLLGDGTGAFPSVTQYGSGDFRDVAVGDLDGNGIPDLALADSDGDSIDILFGDGAGAFGGQLVLVTGGRTQGVAIGDLDGHNGLDLVATNTQTNDVSIILAEDSGGFHAAISRFTGIGGGRGLEIGDVNGDAHLDVVSAAQTDAVSVLRGDGTGGFLPATTYHVGGSFDYLDVVDVGIAELNGDGKPDLVTCDYSKDRVTALLGDGLGGFTQEPPFIADDRPMALASGLLDADGDVDVVTANNYDDGISVLLGDGAGGFGAQTFYTMGEHPLGVVLADLDDDGALDVVTADSFVDTATVRYGNGAGLFGPPVPFKTGTGTYVNPYDVAVGDLDLDGRLDLAAANHGGMSVGVLLGDGTGFAPVTEWPTSWQASGLVISDLDGDGAPDLAVADEEPLTGRATVLRGNGLGGFAPPLLFRTGRAPSAIASGDLDEDGRPDLVAGFDGIGVTMLQNDSLFDVAGWTDLGGAKVGSNGLPKLVATGNFQGDATPGDDPGSFHLQSAPPHAPAVFVVGITLLGKPLKGGTMVPDPLLLLLFLTDDGGHAVQPFELPATVPAGVDLYFQFWISDAGQSWGLSASNGIRGTTSGG